jgi:hypothetical protein
MRSANSTLRAYEAANDSPPAAAAAGPQLSIDLRLGKQHLSHADSMSSQATKKQLQP